MSENHAVPGGAVPSPQMMVARLTGETECIRLGAGGIMLPNHVPLVVAEQFGMLDALAPGRIDLGLGRAPGTDGATASALRRHHAANDEFPQQVAELLGFLENSFTKDHPYTYIIRLQSKVLVLTRVPLLFSQYKQTYLNILLIHQYLSFLNPKLYSTKRVNT